jgi:hypothetical protein
MATTTLTSNPPYIPNTSFSNNASAFIISGDGGIDNATIVPDITSIPNSKNFSIYSNLSNVFNFRQNLSIKNNFTEVNTRDEFPKSFSSSTNNQYFEFQFTTPGYIHMRELILNIPMNITELYAVQPNKLPSMYVQKPFCILNNLYNYEFRLGNNQYQMGNLEFTNDILSIKTFMGALKLSAKETRLRSIFGLPYSVNARFQNPNGTFNYQPLNPQLTNLFDNNFLHWNLTPNNSNAICTTKYFPLPLYFIIPFLNQDAYLPQGIPINFKFYFNFPNNNNPGTSRTFDVLFGEVPTGYITINSYAPVAMANNYANTEATAPIDQNNLQLNYNYKILNHTNAQIFNELIFSNNLLYNHFDYKRFEFLANGGSNYDFNVTWNKQRPVEMFFYVTRNSTSDYLQPLSTTTGATQDYFNQAQSYATGFNFTKFEIYMNGQRNLYFKQFNQNYNYSSSSTSNTVSNTYDVINSYEMLQNLADLKTNLNFVNDEDNQINTLGNLAFGTPLKVCLDPEQHYQKNSRSLDKGTTQIRVSMSVTSLLGSASTSGLLQNSILNPTSSVSTATCGSLYTGVPTGYKFVFLMKFPVQTCIDSHMNVSQVEWPAIRSDSHVYKQQTINSN